MASALNQLLLDTVESLEQVGCQWAMCDGPTLEPVDMVTCHVCALLARVRVAVGQRPRRADELTASQREAERRAAYMRRVTAQ